MTRSRAAALALAWAVSICAAAGAQPSPTAARWQREVVRVDGLLRAGSWDAARAAAGALVDELIRDLKGGPDGARLLATAYAQRALAEAGLGEREGAAWNLRIAVCLDPAFEAAPLEGFGNAGERLARWRDGGRPPDGVLPLATPELVPPEVLEGPTIVFRASAEVLESFDRALRVELVVDEEGRVRHPEVRGSRDNPSPIAASLEALRHWRFEPARLDGRPVPVLLELELPLTSGAAERARAALDALRRDVPP